MQINGALAFGNVWDMDATENKRKYSAIQCEMMRSGDTVDISEDARKMYSEMIHKYDKSASGDSTGEKASSQDGGGNGESGDSADSVESIKKQIQSLKSQMASLASQMGRGNDSAAMSKMNALQAQIAALEAQLNEMAGA